MDSEFLQDRPAEAIAFAAATVEGSGLKTIRLTPDGEVKSVNGTFLIDEEAAGLVVKAFESHGTEIPIDYEHQTLGGDYAAPSGRAPAAGWITRLWREAGKGLFALVRWNSKTVDEIREGSFQYLSPVLNIRKSGGRVVELHSAGLTNKPAIPAMDRLAASNRTFGTETIPMANDEEGQGGRIDAKPVLTEIVSELGLEVDGVEYPGGVLQMVLGAIRKLKGAVTSLRRRSLRLCGRGSSFPMTPGPTRLPWRWRCWRRGARRSWRRLRVSERPRR